ncbi:hypothetical protein [Geobacter sp.]|uniref:hypothetical protein n=1 Tax=Geobacter sp. TaxID=46610 RepID=UPI0027BAD332|nr:hypothetical protein [Geobacter sp.]
MNLLKAMILLLFTAVPTWAVDAMTLNSPLRAEEVTGVTKLGSLQVEGLGRVNLTARREGKRVVIQPVGKDGTVVGKAETVVGFDETPLYVKPPNGLMQLTIRWRSGDN